MVGLVGAFFCGPPSWATWEKSGEMSTRAILTVEKSELTTYDLPHGKVVYTYQRDRYAPLHRGMVSLEVTANVDLQDLTLNYVKFTLRGHPKSAAFWQSFPHLSYYFVYLDSLSATIGDVNPVDNRALFQEGFIQVNRQPKVAQKVALDVANHSPGHSVFQYRPAWHTRALLTLITAAVILYRWPRSMVDSIVSELRLQELVGAAQFAAFLNQIQRKIEENESYAIDFFLENGGGKA